MIQTRRTHDNIYINEDRSATPKEYFKFVASLAEERHAHMATARILDIGCAGGDFLHYLHQRFPEAELHGVDLLPALVETAHSKVPEATIVTGDIDGETVPTDKKYDVIFMLGVHSIFDQTNRWTTNVTNMLAEDGVAFIFGLFNPAPYDVLVKVRKADGDSPYEPGWNCFSTKTIAESFTKNAARVDFVPWTIGIDIAANEADPLRSWTTTLADGSRLVTNATRIIHDFFCAVVHR